MTVTPLKNQEAPLTEQAKNKEKGTLLANKELSHKLQKDRALITNCDKFRNQVWTERNNLDMMRK